MQKNLVHIDQKILTPGDNIATKAIAPSKSKKRPNSIIGLPKIYDLKGNLLASEENLVVLSGREFLSQKLLGAAASGGTDYTNYSVRYFGIGSGGTTAGTVPETVGPYDLDIDLASPLQFNNVAGEISSSTNGYQYVGGGFLKKIESDGSIEIVQEEHTVNTADSGAVTVQRYTSIKFTLKIDVTEPASKPAKFNEAALWAVEYDPATGVPSDNKVLFARFTTLDKYLDTNDGIIIEWHVLV